MVVYDLTVVGKSKITGIMMEEEWLDILCSFTAGITVTHMTDGHLAGKHIHLLLVEYLCH